MQRGAIRNPEYRQQLADFTGLRWGAITPTDLDGFIDFSDKLFVFIEGKHGTASMPYGQELALQRLCDAAHGPSGRAAVAFVVNHNTPLDKSIDYASANVAKYRWKGQWLFPTSGLHLFEGIERIRRIVFPAPPNDHAEWIAAYDKAEREHWPQRAPP